ncbi:MAG: radical SAM family heme chaperone HemW [Prosthecobacter sp.]|uniref:radical SAM family heme chaperone HemW n=1 Tax=Prosthecobacter sp. TaxID=1965333 RepID=UPI002623A0CF|nr:radical SAM family heme chaperone HemW [Prosthecobacter sp.]MCF7789775.1 radical SAM family heme chaperone HemW [Prosthecobacter sp.]
MKHLYVHIPFCHRICPYCSFHKHTPGGTDMVAFVDALLREMEKQPLKPQTIFFGGGTPTMLSDTHMERLLRGMRERVDMADVVEFTMEANPRNVTASKAAMMRELGVTRVSLGIQAWDDETLKTLGRDHTCEQAQETWGVLCDAQFPSLNLDLMFSIPGQSLDTWRNTLAHTIVWGPDHISAYNLNYEEDTDFFRRLKTGEFRLDENRDADFFNLTIDMLEADGFEHYEISNYAKPGYRSIHNEAYWLGEDYLGIGPGAFSTVGGRRWNNVKDTPRYMAMTLAGEATAVDVEELTADQRRTERFGLELRTARGLPLELINDESRKMLETLREQGLLSYDESHVRLTRVGKPLVDPIAVALMG